MPRRRTRRQRADPASRSRPPVVAASAGPAPLAALSPCSAAHSPKSQQTASSGGCGTTSGGIGDDSLCAGIASDAAGMMGADDWRAGGIGRAAPSSGSRCVPDDVARAARRASAISRACSMRNLSRRRRMTEGSSTPSERMAVVGFNVGIWRRAMPQGSRAAGGHLNAATFRTPVTCARRRHAIGPHDLRIRLESLCGLC